MTRQLFLDLDGVLADFDRGYFEAFGIKPDKTRPESAEFWDRVRSKPDFYRTLPPMSDALDLWRGALPYRPIILTGVPRSVPGVDVQKLAWVAEHISQDAQVICCPSRNKWLYANTGDVLVDDWVKYRHLWLEIGGVFILHTSAADSLRQLHKVMTGHAL